MKNILVLAGFTLASAALWGGFGRTIALVLSDRTDFTFSSEVSVVAIIFGGAPGAALGAVLLVLYDGLVLHIDGDWLDVGVISAMLILGSFFGGILGIISVWSFGFMGFFMGGVLGIFAGALVLDQANGNRYTPVRETITPEGVLGQLTASEIIFLKGIPWRSEGSDRVFHVQSKGPRLSAAQLGPALATAVLAIEQSGAIRLELAQKKVFSGLFTMENLYVIQSGKDANWPSGSLEERFEREEYHRPITISDIIHPWLGGDRHHPWAPIAERIMTKMVVNGDLLLDVTPKRVCALFTVPSKRFVLPKRTEAIVTGREGDAASQLLDTCRQTRADMHRRLLKGIDHGLKSYVRPVEFDPGSW